MEEKDSQHAIFHLLVNKSNFYGFQKLILITDQLSGIIMGRKATQQT